MFVLHDDAAFKAQRHTGRQLCHMGHGGHIQAGVAGQKQPPAPQQEIIQHGGFLVRQVAGRGEHQQDVAALQQFRLGEGQLVHVVVFPLQTGD